MKAAKFPFRKLLEHADFVILILFIKEKYLKVNIVRYQIQEMTYQEKFDELQNIFSEKFDAYKKFQKELTLGNNESDEFLIAKSEFEKAKSEFEKASNDFQSFLILFNENNPSPNDEFGTIGQRCL